MASNGSVGPLEIIDHVLCEDRDLPKAPAANGYQYPRGRFPHGYAWGPWLLDANRLCLCRVRPGVTDPVQNVYEIDLEEITSAFWLTDWLEHVALKTWATPEVLGHLTCAMISLFHPRDWMRDGKRVDPSDLLKRSIDREW